MPLPNTCVQFDTEGTDITRMSGVSLVEDAPPLLFPSEKKSDMDSSPEERMQDQVKTLSVELSENIKVCVWKADLTTFVVDGIVNAANEDLQHCGGLALALSTAGGPVIRAESDLHICTYGKLRTGEAIVTSAGNLPCKKVIHAVGPRVKQNPSPAVLSKAKKTLKDAVWSILHKVREHHLQSVAIPAISSGIFNFPLPMCADIVVSTVKEFHDQTKSENQHLTVHLVNNDEPSVKEMERACREILVSPTSNASQTVPEKMPQYQEEQVVIILKTDQICFKLHLHIDMQHRCH